MSSFSFFLAGMLTMLAVIVLYLIVLTLRRGRASQPEGETAPK